MTRKMQLYSACGHCEFCLAAQESLPSHTDTRRQPAW